MSDICVKTIKEIGAYDGPKAIPGIKFRTAGHDLGVTAWGMNALELEPNCSGYPEHDHAENGQEELYVLMSGSATLHAGERQWPLETGTLVRVGPTTKRKIVAGPDGATVLAIGGTPGKPYVPRG